MGSPGAGPKQSDVLHLFRLKSGAEGVNRIGKIALFHAKMLSQFASVFHKQVHNRLDAGFRETSRLTYPLVSRYFRAMTQNILLVVGSRMGKAA